MPDKNLYGTTFKVPDKCVDNIRNAVSNFNGSETTKGFERAKNIIKNPNISLELLKKINNFFRNEEEGTVPYQLTGGDYGKKIFNNMEQQVRRSKESSRDSKMGGGMENTHLSPHEKNGLVVNQEEVPDVRDINLSEQINKIKKLINYL
jgi:hypothetical protein